MHQATVATVLTHMQMYHGQSCSRCNFLNFYLSWSFCSPIKKILLTCGKMYMELLRVALWSLHPHLEATALNRCILHHFVSSFSYYWKCQWRMWVPRLCELHLQRVGHIFQLSTATPHGKTLCYQHDMTQYTILFTRSCVKTIVMPHLRMNQ